VPIRTYTLFLFLFLSFVVLATLLLEEGAAVLVVPAVVESSSERER
jgi:hypothetical protein